MFDMTCFDSSQYFTLKLACPHNSTTTSALNEEVLSLEDTLFQFIRAAWSSTPKQKLQNLLHQAWAGCFYCQAMSHEPFTDCSPVDFGPISLVLHAKNICCTHINAIHHMCWLPITYFYWEMEQRRVLCSMNAGPVCFSLKQPCICPILQCVLSWCRSWHRIIFGCMNCICIF